MLNPFSQFFLSFALIESNDILSRKTEIKGYIASAKLDLAVKRVMDFCQDFGNMDFEREALKVSFRHNDIKKKEDDGILNYDAALPHRMRVVESILTIITDISSIN